MHFPSLRHGWEMHSFSSSSQNWPGKYPHKILAWTFWLAIQLKDSQSQRFSGMPTSIFLCFFLVGGLWFMSWNMKGIFFWNDFLDHWILCQRQLVRKYDVLNKTQKMNSSVLPIGLWNWQANASIDTCNYSLLKMKHIAFSIFSFR